MMRFLDLSHSEAVEMFISDSSLLGNELGDLMRSMFDQLDKFVSDEDAFVRPAPNRTD